MPRRRSVPKNKEEVERSLKESAQAELNQIVKDAAEEYSDLLRESKFAKAKAARMIAEHAETLAQVLVNVALSGDRDADKIRAASLGLQLLDDHEELKLSVGGGSGLTINITPQQADKIQQFSNL